MVGGPPHKADGAVAVGINVGARVGVMVTVAAEVGETVIVTADGGVVVAAVLHPTKFMHKATLTKTTRRILRRTREMRSRNMKFIQTRHEPLTLFT